jgi:hypothetical protein
MKTSVVGMNNNELEITLSQAILSKDFKPIYHRNYVHPTVNVMYGIDMIHFIKRFSSNTLSEYLYRVCLSILSPKKQLQLRFGKTTINEFLSLP